MLSEFFVSYELYLNVVHPFEILKSQFFVNQFSDWYLCIIHLQTILFLINRLYIILLMTKYSGLNF